MPNLDVNKYAQIGARVRLAELQSEIDSIHAAFPELRAGVSMTRRRGRPPKQTATDGQNAGNPPQRKRRGMSAAQRREVSERMKKYWAQRRKAEAKAR